MTDLYIQKYRLPINLHYQFRFLMLQCFNRLIKSIWSIKKHLEQQFTFLLIKRLFNNHLISLEAKTSVA